MSPTASLPPLGGVLLVDKPEGPTSHDVVHRVRRALGERRVGHTGTLDPFASGLLVLCVGPATRLAEYLTGVDKEYLAVVRLGQRTTTHDREGEVVAESDAWRALTPEQLAAGLTGLRGEILQVPPEFSAKKTGGVPAHRRARRGESFELPAVPVVVRELELGAVELPDVHLRVRCSSGTYVRALARDWGEALGVGGHLRTLRRTRVGALSVEEAASPSMLDDGEALAQCLMPTAKALAHLPSVSLDDADLARLAQGQSVVLTDAELPEEVPLVVLREGTLVAVATAAGGRLRPRKVLSAERAS